MRVSQAYKRNVWLAAILLAALAGFYWTTLRHVHPHLDRLTTQQFVSDCDSDEWWCALAISDYFSANAVVSKLAGQSPEICAPKGPDQTKIMHGTLGWIAAHPELEKQKAMRSAS